ncbi:MAG: efflux RND transporter permease subunit [Bryobacteraceae bacterium]
MAERLLEFALRKRLVTLLMGLAVAALGYWAFTRLKIEAYTDISDVQVVVIALYPGHAPEEVEQQITLPIERSLNNVPRVTARRSRTIFGLSVVDLTFEYGTAENLARQMVIERLRDAPLPEGVEATLAPPTTPAGELYRYQVVGAGYSPIELRELQDWVIAPRLLQAPGVGDAFAFGGLVKQYQIEADPLALYKYKLSIRAIADAVGANNRNSGGSLLRSGQQDLVVRGVGLLRSAADIENVVVASVRGTPVFVRDVGRVRMGAAPQTGIFGLNAETGGVEGVVAMRRDENPSEVLKAVREAVEELNHGGLPAGVRIEPVYDRTELVAGTLRTVSRTLLEGFTIVFLALLFLLGSFQAAILTAITVPLSLLFAFLCMYLYGIPASLLSLGALDFGIVVDGTLVMVEFIVRRLSAAPSPAGEAANTAEIRKSVLLVERAIVFSLLILVAAYIPLFALERVERRLFAPMAFTVCAALAGSLLFTITLAPVLASLLFRHGCRTWHNPLIPWLTRRYEAFLGVLLNRLGAVIAVTVALFAAAGFLATRLGTEFLPKLDEGVIWVRAILPPGVSLEKSAEVAAQVRALALESPEVTLAASQTGRQESNTEPFGPNKNELLLALKPYAEWPAGKRKPDLVNELAARFRAQVPGVTFSFTQPMMDMVTEAVTGSSADLAVIFSGPDLGVLRTLAGRALAILREIPGAADTAIEQEADQPQLHIGIRRDEVARHGLNVGDVQEVIELAVGGRPVSQIFEGERRFDITVRYVPEARGSAGEIGNIMVPAPDGSRVPLARLADIRIAAGSTIITRRNNRRQINVRTNIRGRDQGGFVAEAQRRIGGQIAVPPGYRVEWGGEFENLDRARRRLAWVLPLTIFIIFLLLYWAFNSVPNAGLVLLNVPFSIVGGVAALYLRDIPFSVSAAVGFVSLFGVAVMSGVLYVAEINRQRFDAGRPLRAAVLAGACAQLRPRLILILVATFGMVPAAFATGIGSDIQRPLATVVLGGLVSTLFLSLLALPCLYYLMEARRNR